ncbi:LLM class flavin-dependent oxidoreductase [Corynebacterium pacaense]|uniref:LLM class flavin-dependent oxidoreductase n=1 Tax=Corynebacterium pacaense TaxID=1816684 RepID=UPI0015C4D660|nr:LLM class flavin-dependent oxidoreductase [Corynebacterium pacaense]
MSQPFTLGIHIDGLGSHPGDAGGEDAGSGGALDAARIQRIISRIESAGFSYATFAGSHLPGAAPRLDSVQLGAFVGPSTSRLGLIAQIPATYLEPFHIATQLISVDYATRGRGGWLVSAENSAAAAAQYGRVELSEEQLGREIDDVVEVVRLLQDSWEVDAVIRDLPSGRYIDRDKLHPVDFVGASFSVRGPAITPRPPQGQVPIIADLDAAPDATSGARVDAVLVAAEAAVIDRARAAVDGARVIADLEVVVDSRGEAAPDRLARLDAVVPWATGKARFAGSAPELVDRITELAQVADGVRLIPASLNEDLDELVHVVLPELIARGVLTPPAAGATLREVFGLGAARNIFSDEGVLVR